MADIGLFHYLTVASVLFTLGVFGIFLNRRSVITILMWIELILLAVNINFVAFSVHLNNLAGQVFAMFVLTVAAAQIGHRSCDSRGFLPQPRLHRGRGYFGAEGLGAPHGTPCRLFAARSICRGRTGGPDRRRARGSDRDMRGRGDRRACLCGTVLSGVYRRRVQNLAAGHMVLLGRFRGRVGVANRHAVRGDDVRHHDRLVLRPRLFRGLYEPRSPQGAVHGVFKYLHFCDVDARERRQPNSAVFWMGGGGACVLCPDGFWNEKHSANAAAVKAFVVNRVGDFGLALGIMATFAVFGTVRFDDIFALAPGKAAGTPFSWAGPFLR